MKKHSAGILMYRRASQRRIEVLLVHPGGPFWANKDTASWSMPKGEFDEQEDPLLAAQREFSEETGATISGYFITLQPLKQPSGKIIHAFAVEGNWDVSQLVSNTFELEWPPRSGKSQNFPEVDRAEWFDTDVARTKLHKGQVGFLDQLLDVVSCE